MVDETPTTPAADQTPSDPPPEPTGAYRHIANALERLNRRLGVDLEVEAIIEKLRSL